MPVKRGAYDKITGFRNVDGFPIAYWIPEAFISWFITDVFCSPPYLAGQCYFEITPVKL